MDVQFDLNGVHFVWDASKARNDEARDAIIGFDSSGRLLSVVHIQVNEERIRIISARRATTQEREHYDS